MIFLYDRIFSGMGFRIFLEKIFNIFEKKQKSALKNNKRGVYYDIILIFGRLAQLVRASRLHRECRGFESLIAHHLQILKSSVKYD